MTAPTFFAVEYAINPWMDTSTPVDTHVAMNQWETLRQTYKELGPHRRVGRARRRPARHGLRRQRRPAGERQGRRRPVRLPAARRRVRRLRRVDDSPRLRPAETRHVNEGQGDLLVVGSIVLAGYGFRTERRAHAEIAAAVRCRWSASNWSIRGSITSTPRWRCSTTPRSPTTRRRSATSHARGCSSCSPTPSRWPAPTPTCSASTPCPTASTSSCPPPPPASPSSLRDAGFRPIGVDLSELLKGGGSVKCCTLEVHP